MDNAKRPLAINFSGDEVETLQADGDRSVMTLSGPIAP